MSYRYVQQLGCCALVHGNRLCWDCVKLGDGDRRASVKIASSSCCMIAIRKLPPQRVGQALRDN
eukprot:1649771-Amphidinium_carterae.1